MVEVIMTASRKPTKRSINRDFAADWRLFDRSEKAQQILARCPQIEDELRARPTKILPVLRVARLFNISERLLWKWIEQQVLSTYRRPSKRPENYKKGIKTKSIRDFLCNLAACGEMRDQRDECGWSDRRRVKTRTAPAVAKCREGMKTLKSWEPTPRQYADAVGVSVSTVYRMLNDQRLNSYRPTKKRIRICGFSIKRRKSLLTRKKR